MVEYVSSLEEKELTWKKYRQTEINHIIPQLRTFGRKNLSIGGYNRTINAVTETHGPSQRLVVELGPEVKAWSNMAGGQSGNPGNPHYDYFVDSWTKGIYHELLFMKEKTDSPNKIIFHQKILNPGK
jgi:penicillin amidase